MKLIARVKRGAADRLTLLLVLGVAIAAFATLDWLKLHVGDYFLKLILFGFALITLALVTFTISRLKASGLKPPTWKELREGAAAKPTEGEAPAEKLQDEKRGGQ
jgi:uncharacterized membrane protein YfcA